MFSEAMSHIFLICAHHGKNLKTCVQDSCCCLKSTARPPQAISIIFKKKHTKCKARMASLRLYIVAKSQATTCKHEIGIALFSAKKKQLTYKSQLCYVLCLSTENVPKFNTFAQFKWFSRAMQPKSQRDKHTVRVCGAHKS